MYFRCTLVRECQATRTPSSKSSTSLSSTSSSHSSRWLSLDTQQCIDFQSIKPQSLPITSTEKVCYKINIKFKLLFFHMIKNHFHTQLTRTANEIPFEMRTFHSLNPFQSSFNPFFLIYFCSFISIHNIIKCFNAWTQCFHSINFQFNLF